mmetsp:Transcript_22034/g.53334  ORF Transcript_22034/g.53334 Transcript_22034/m.53334 type:complete len:204 (+) Transcript_22034:1116-1727(+)
MLPCRLPYRAIAPFLMASDSTFAMIRASDVRAVASINPITPLGPAEIPPEFISSISRIGSTNPSFAFPPGPPSMTFAQRPARTVSYLSPSLNDENAAFSSRSLSDARIISPRSMADEFGRCWHSDEDCCRGRRRGWRHLCRPSAFDDDSDGTVDVDGPTNASAGWGLHSSIEPAIMVVSLATTCRGLLLSALSFSLFNIVSSL